MRILIAEDDAILADGLVRSLRQAGYTVDQVHDGAEALAVDYGAFDLLILDIGLPRVSGIEVLKRLRQEGVAVPVLILTALDGVRDRVSGLDAGADDYLAKPFALEELEARIRALNRRGQGSLVRHGPLTFDLKGRVAELNGVPLELSARETGLLEILVTRSGRMVSKDQMVSLLCEWDEDLTTNAIEVYVHRLRRKLEPGGVKIATVRGLGYCLAKAGE